MRYTTQIRTGRGGPVAGIITPVALMVIIVLAILGGTLVFLGTSSYTQTAIALYGLKAQMLADAVAEEAQAAVYDVFNRPPVSIADVDNPYKAERAALVTAIQTALSASPPDHGPLKKVFAEGDDLDLTRRERRSLIARSDALAKTPGIDGTVLEARVRFSGFRVMPYAGDGTDTTPNTYADPNSYYFNKTVDGAAKTDPKDLATQDAIGYYTIFITTQVRDQRRSLSVVHDVKILNVTPPAHEFALFQTLDLSDADFKDHLEHSLNPGKPSDPGSPGGGVMRLYPEGWGRVYMRAPYVVELPGYKDGAGGQSPGKLSDGTARQVMMPTGQGSGTVNTPMPGTEALTSADVWYKWGMLPGPRAGRMKSDFFVMGTPQMRPDKASGGFWASLNHVWTSLPGLSAGGSVYRHVGVDPGSLLDSNQVWFTGYNDEPLDAAAGTSTFSTFSIIGDPAGETHNAPGPSGKAWARISSFRGTLVHLDSKSAVIDKDTAAYDPRKDNPLPGKKDADGMLMDGRTLGDPATAGDTWMLLPEVQAKARVRVKEFKQFGVDWHSVFTLHLSSAFSGTYQVQDFVSDKDKIAAGVTTTPLALYWEPLVTQPWYEAAFDAVLSAGPLMWAVSAPLSLATLALNVVNPERFFAGNVAVPGAPKGSTGAKPNQSWPSNTKLYERAATRYYQDASKIKSINTWVQSVTQGSPLILDGVIWARKLQLQTAFSYWGKGILFSKFDPGINQTQGQLQGPIEPHTSYDPNKPSTADNIADWLAESKANPTTDRTASYLTVVYQGTDEKGYDGGQALVVSPFPGATNDRGGIIDASLVSTQGVIPQGDKAWVTVKGNLVCGMLAKGKSRPDTTLHVVYDSKHLRPEADMNKVNPGSVPTGYFKSADWTVIAVSPRVAGYSER